MVKFRDLNSDNIDSTKGDQSKKIDESRGNSRLSFRKLAAEGRILSEDKEVSGRVGHSKEQNDKGGKVLYQKACAYLKQVLETVKQRKMFSPDPGFRIIREMVEVQSFQDSLFIEALHFDDPLQFIIHNNVNVAIYAIKMAENLGWSKDRQIEIGMAGLLHDVGMALIPEKLVYKQQRLSQAELEIFKKRSNYSYKILKSFGDEYANLAECAAQANERLDGSGYPQGLKGDEIHEYAQIIGLVDMYEALIHSRPQRVKFHHFIAVKEIIKSGKHLFQRKHLKALLNIFSIFPLYSYVRLNSNAIGKVLETYPDQPMRPKIQIVFDSQQKRVLTERIVSLPDDPLLYIVDSVSEEELQQISKSPDVEPRGQSGREKKEDDSDSEKAEIAVIDDKSPPKMEKKDDQVDTAQKSGWFKPVLIIAVIALVVAGLVMQFGNKNSKPPDAGRLQMSVTQKITEGIPAKESKALSLPSENERRVQEDTVQEKPAVFLAPDSKNLGSGGEGIEAKAAKESGLAVGTVTPYESASEKTEESPSAAPVGETESMEASDKHGLHAEKAKVLYPYSIKLDAFRSRERVEKSLAIYREKGLSPYWVKVDLGDQGVWYRVFAGCYEDSQQAEEVIRTHKLTEAAVKKTTFGLLIGVYRSEAELSNQVQALSKLDFSPYVIKRAADEFYLYVGAFYSEKGARDFYTELLSNGIQSKVVER